MPKLSADSLQKRFSCPHCGQSLRTRQGLSGHIQWRHKEKQSGSTGEVVEAILEMKKLETICKAAGISEHDSQAVIDTMRNWYKAELFCKIMNVALSRADFKTFLVTSFAGLLQTRN